MGIYDAMMKHVHDRAKKVDEYTVSLSGIPERKEGDSITRLLPGYQVVTIEDHEAAIKAKEEEIARLREALKQMKNFLSNQILTGDMTGYGTSPMIIQASCTLLAIEAALAKEATRDKAE